jgi:tyrosine-protein phosphatase YwqE
MFSFFKRKQLDPFPFQILKTDYHSHIIPGIDDGSPNPETSIMLIKGLMDLGYENFVGTPHVMEDIWQNNTDTINAAHEILQQSLKDAGIDKSIRQGAEYLVDGNFEKLLSEKKKLLTIKDNWVLIEISFVQPPKQLHDIIFEMQMQGYQPVFAHPERYNYYQAKKDELQKVKSAGCLFQSNLLSFLGYYGPDVIKFSEWLIAQDMIDILSTDLHHENHLNALRNLKLTPALKSLLDSISFKNMLSA